MLLDRFPSMGLRTEHPQFHKGIVLRGLESLPVSCLK